MMDNHYIVSDKIDIFPVAKTRTTQPSSRLLYEDNIANIIRQLIDVDGFIISGGKITNDFTLEEDLVFNLCGYNIVIKTGYKFDILPSGNQLIGVLSYHDETVTGIKELNTDKSDESLDVGEETIKTYTYKGFYITDSIPKDTPHIILFEKDEQNGNWKVYKDSYIKFNFTSLGVSGIDGKVQ